MNLDEQQRRAYLDAMGIDVWLPRLDPDAELDVPAVEPPAAAGDLDWDTLQETVATGTGCSLHQRHSIGADVARARRI